ncbi:MAG: molecular chaperone HtpG [Caldilineaceae bacterium]
MADNTTTSPTESLEYRAEVKQLLDILAHSLYTDREVFLRELISNASDALNRVQFEMLTNHDVVDPEAELAIRITVDEEAKTITISDTGIGMNREEMVQNLGTIAHSGARTFLQNAGESKSTLEEIIGQFGVGFYSVFMVADEVTVTSRSYRKEDEACTWQSSGDSRFTLSAADKQSRGTDIFIKLKEDAREFGAPWRLETVIKKHSDYVSFPIYVIGKEGEAKMANRRTALWRQSPSSVEPAQYVEFYKQLTYDDQDPLLHIHMVADAPANVRSILYVPSRRERSALRLRPDFGLRLYSRKILIQEHSKDLLPEYLRFIEGVVDSEDLPLNVSRETVQSNPVMRQLKRALTNRITKELKTWSEQESEEGQAKYATFWAEFGGFIKEGVATEFGSQEALTDLLRFHSSKVGEEAWTSLKQYVERMGEEQKAIYYVLGDSLRSVARSPHLDYFRAHNIEVLYLADPLDGYMVSMLREYGGKQLQNVDDANLDLPAPDKSEESPAQEVGQEDFDKLVARVKQVLGEQVREVRASKTLVDHAARLVTPEDSPDRNLQYLRRLMEDKFETPVKILELNRQHPLIVSLAGLAAGQPDDERIDASISQLFDNLLLMEGSYQGPVADMVDRIQQLMGAALKR